ncbi:hypothetical protein BCR33DRAFT_786511 [Rhizoclosmatium globosum]|uniref:DUF659 domain-containing protein n=1 Tax=Rhizoclosmatium globosum TaxID=329046 RepID=A0A1Y2C5Z6_9FUNG|nr:hypothetical protein BCR33DRAFT_786511 [Rhizoclosmatium globosum]|eukprot:ORY42304.1 hypothetical protein BCR33DRAFT_786511 [Rhizoclosmatium globosum]
MDKHLMRVHSITKAATGTTEGTIQPTINSKVPIGSARDRKEDTTITEYLIKCVLPPAHVETAGFIHLQERQVPWYSVKSAATYRRRILVMYVCLQYLLTEFVFCLFSKTQKGSMSFNGWSSPQRKGLHVVTYLWLSLITKSILTVILDFMSVLPGDGVGDRFGDALFQLTVLFKIESKIVATCTDNGADAIKAQKRLGHNLQVALNYNALPLSHQLRPLPSSAILLWLFVAQKYYMTALFSTAKTMHGKAYEPPCEDSTTCWTSTDTMCVGGIKRQKAFDATVFSHWETLELYKISQSDWMNLKDVSSWLSVPAEYTTFIGGQLYPTMSMASLVFQDLISHCNEGLDSDSPVISKVSECMRDKFIAYAEIMDSHVARIAKLLDPTLRKGGAADPEFLIDRSLVQTVMEEH